MFGTDILLRIYNKCFTNLMKSMQIVSKAQTTSRSPNENITTDIFVVDKVYVHIIYYFLFLAAYSSSRVGILINSYNNR